MCDPNIIKEQLERWNRLLVMVVEKLQVPFSSY